MTNVNFKLDILVECCSSFDFKEQKSRSKRYLVMGFNFIAQFSLSVAVLFFLDAVLKEMLKFYFVTTRISLEIFYKLEAFLITNVPHKIFLHAIQTQKKMLLHACIY